MVTETEFSRERRKGHAAKFCRLQNRRSEPSWAELRPRSNDAPRQESRQDEERPNQFDSAAAARLRPRPPSPLGSLRAGNSSRLASFGNGCSLLGNAIPRCRQASLVRGCTDAPALARRNAEAASWAQCEESTATINSDSAAAFPRSSRSNTPWCGSESRWTSAPMSWSFVTKTRPSAAASVKSARSPGSAGRSPTYSTT
jgi:hypothetical protein